MFFSKKPKKVEPSFQVYFTKLAKYQQMIKLLVEENKSSKLLYFFNKTKEEISELIAAANLTNCEILDAHTYFNTTPEKVYLVETHPLASVTDKLLSKLHQETDLQCFIGMDELLMKLFGSERLMNLMEKMAMKSDEVISHTLVTSSIKTAQVKLDEKLPKPVDERESPELWAHANGIDQIVL